MLDGHRHFPPLSPHGQDAAKRIPLVSAQYATIIIVSRLRLISLFGQQPNEVGMPVIDFQDPDQFDAAIEFLVRRGIAFHSRPPQCVVLRTEDYQALQQAKIVPNAKANGSRGEKNRRSPKS